MSDELAITLALSGLGLIAIVGLLFVNPKADNRGSSRWYHLGKADPFYRIPFRSDGSLRKYTKLLLVLWIVLVISIGLAVTWCD